MYYVYVLHGTANSFLEGYSNLAPESMLKFGFSEDAKKTSEISRLILYLQSNCRINCKICPS